VQTNFSQTQLQNPRIAEANDLLRRCIHCGLCTATCPTYVLGGDERDSPRGRIYLMKEMFEGEGKPGKSVRTHVDRCLSCLSCMTSCPSDVDYMHLVDLGRAHIEENTTRPFGERATRATLAYLLPHPGRFRVALWAAVAGRALRRALARIGLRRVAAMLDLAPAGGPKRGTFAASGVVRPEGAKRHRVALLMGCAQRSLRPSINDATIRLLNRHGVEVAIPEGQGCCGALVHHLGRHQEAEGQIKRNVDLFNAPMRHEDFHAIIVNASGCGTMMKDYGHLLARDKAYAERAGQVAGAAMDITEYLTKIGLAPPKRWTDLTVAYHSACSMRNGQRLDAEPRALLQRAGFSVVDVGESHMCCGSAGSYNILQPEIASELRDRKAEHIAKTDADLVATGNIGCITQLQGAVDLPVVHTAELLDWALGGPCPRELRALADRARSVQKAAESAPSQPSRFRRKQKVEETRG
jgi:glycolate oxidase iron-sulfur subunit